MEGLNNAVFFVCDKIIELQAAFIGHAWGVAKVVLIIALCTAAINYAISGSGFKESLVKIIKAFIFFAIVMKAYPSAVGWITTYTYELANTSMYPSIEATLNKTQLDIAENSEYMAVENKKGTYGNTVTTSEKVSEDKDPRQYFGEMTKKRTKGETEYTVVAPAAVLRIVLLVAGECFRAADEAPRSGGILDMPDIGMVIKGTICAFFVIFTGIFAVLDYLIAFLEFMFITSVGIILFPTMLWDGSKFLSEKFVGAVVGFFVKLLFCNICIFIMLWGFITLAKQYTVVPFTGLPDEIISLAFSCLLFFYICKSGPALAQGLLSGSPSLNAAGAIGAAGAAVGAAAAVGGMAGGAVKAVAGGAAKAGFEGASALTKAGAAAGAAKTLGGGAGAQAGAFMSSLGGSAKEGLKGAGGDLARSLIGGKGGGDGGGGAGGAAGINPHSNRDKLLKEKNADGTRKGLGQHFSEKKSAGENAGLDYMAKQEAKADKKAKAQDYDYQSQLKIDKAADSFSADMAKKGGYEQSDIQAGLDYIRGDGA